MRKSSKKDKKNYVLILNDILHE